MNSTDRSVNAYISSQMFKAESDSFVNIRVAMCEF